MASRNVLVALGAGAVLAMPCAAQATLASTHNVVVNISSQFAGQPGYEGLRTYAIFVLFTNPGDRLNSHGLWNARVEGVGCFVNADPVADDPLGLIPDTAGGSVPVLPGILALRGYEAWAWDTNLSVDNNPLSLPDPGTQLDVMHIHGGSFIIPPPFGALAGPDQMVQIAQITLSDPSTSMCGTATVVYVDAGSSITHSAEISVGTLGCNFSSADFNFDLSVNTLDLGILLSNWSIPAGSPACGGNPCCHVDLNEDGTVNSLDLGILLNQWYEYPHP